MNYEQFKLGESRLPFRPESSVVCMLSKYITTEIYTTTGRFIMFSVITNIYNKKTKGPALMELFTATGKLKKVFFDN
jgi:hypothetical protein